MPNREDVDKLREQAEYFKEKSKEQVEETDGVMNQLKEELDGWEQIKEQIKQSVVEDEVEVENYEVVDDYQYTPSSVVEKDITTANPAAVAHNNGGTVTPQDNHNAPVSNDAHRNIKGAWGPANKSPQRKSYVTKARPDKGIKNV